MFDDLSAYTDHELREELKRREEERKRTENDYYYAYSEQAELSATIERNYQDKDGTELVEYWIVNGSWRGSRCENWFIIHSPLGDFMVEITDWKLTKRKDKKTIPKEYREWY
jgi:hypothetical protein